MFRTRNLGRSDWSFYSETYSKSWVARRRVMDGVHWTKRAVWSGLRDCWAGERFLSVHATGRWAGTRLAGCTSS